MSPILKRCLILLAIGLTACTSPQSTPIPSLTSVSETKEMLLTATPQPVEKSTPTGSALPVLSPTTLPTLAPTPTEAVISEACFHENVTMPNTVVPNGILVIGKVGYGVSLLNFSSHTHQDIAELNTAAPMNSIGVSPDGKWLAYEVIENNRIQIVIESIDGKKIKVTKALNWDTKILWLDNQRVWFPEFSTIQPATSVLVLNPFSGQRELIKTDYPGIGVYNYGTGPIKYHFGYSSAVYDPSLDYVIYPEFAKGSGYFQTLWDRKLGKAIARVPSSSNYQNMPIWQASQNQFLIVGYPDPAIHQNEWLSVSLDGQVHKITDFGKTGQKYKIENDAVLSPDEKTLAFSLSFLKEDGYDVDSTHLILLDLETGKGRDTCIPADKITWSLDGRYLAVATRIKYLTNSRVLLFDLKTSQVYPVSESSKEYPVGWLSQP